MAKWSRTRIKLSLLAIVAGLSLNVGCLSSQFGSDLAATTISAIWGDTLYTILDYVLPPKPTV